MPEGAKQPNIVWTDHKNLEYLELTRRLNSHLTFFTRFLFTLSYRPSSSNSKPEKGLLVSPMTPSFHHPVG